MTGQCSTPRGGSGTVMRHFLPARAFAAPAPVAALALGVTVPAASRLLIPTSRRAARFTPSETAATRPAVLLAPITARADQHLAPAPGTEKQSSIVHRSPRRGGLDDPHSPGNTALGAGRSLGHDRQVSGVRGCVGLLADCDLTPTHERRHHGGVRRRRPLTGNLGSGGQPRHAPSGSAGTIPSRCAPLRQRQLTKAVRRISALLRSHQQRSPVGGVSGDPGACGALLEPFFSTQSPDPPPAWAAGCSLPPSGSPLTPVSGNSCRFRRARPEVGTSHWFASFSSAVRIARFVL